MVYAREQAEWYDLTEGITAYRLGFHRDESLLLEPGVHQIGPIGGSLYEIRSLQPDAQPSLQNREVVLIPRVKVQLLKPVRNQE